MNSINKLKKLACNGYADAQIKLGDCYYWGHGIEKDRTEAMIWYGKAADNGSEEAKNKLLENTQV